MLNKLNSDVVNIILMILSAIIAFYFPFQLFLFVYAFFGPLHYLTEINWLKERNFFTTEKNDYWLLLLILAIIGIILFTPVSVHLKKSLPILIAFAFFSSFGMQYFNNQKSKFQFYAIGFTMAVVFFLFFKEKSKILFSIFLPSLVHVFVFTGIFILVGTLQRGNLLGKISLWVYIICAFLLLSLPYFPITTSVSKNIIENYISFKQINQALISFFSDNSNDVFNSKTGILIMRFIAYAYTYHYLNWFSKTSIIQWHNTSKFKLFFILLLWLVSVLLYLFNYKIALKWLFLLSLAHVFLEFPLNFKTLSILKNKLINT